MQLNFILVTSLIDCFSGRSRNLDVAALRAGPVGLASPVRSSLHVVVGLVALTRAEVYESVEAYSEINL